MTQFSDSECKSRLIDALKLGSSYTTQEARFLAHFDANAADKEGWRRFMRIIKSGSSRARLFAARLEAAN